MKQFIEENHYYSDNRDERVVGVSDLEAYMEGKVVVDAEDLKMLINNSEQVGMQDGYIDYDYSSKAKKIGEKYKAMIATQEGE